MLALWAVTARLNTDPQISVPKDLRSWALSQVAIATSDCPGVFKVDENGIYFVGIKDNDFRNCFGWLPLSMSYADPYQAIPQGDTKWFIHLLTTKGFKDVSR